MIHFELFYHLVRKGQFNPQTIFVEFRQLEKKYILGIHTKKIIIPASFYGKILYLIIPYKFETSRAELLKAWSALTIG